MKNNILFNLLLLALALSIFGCKSGGSGDKSSTLSFVDAEKIEVLKKGTLSEEEIKKWWRLDLEKDTVPGASIDRAYQEIIKDNAGTPVIVAVIDAGLDVHHEDLKSSLWKNPQEKAGNNKDDDGNGYVDDVNGWNFLGENNIMSNSFTRVVRKLGKKYKDVSPSMVLEKDKLEYQTYLKAKKMYEDTYRNIYTPMQEELKRLARLEKAHQEISKILKKENYTKSDLSKITNTKLKASVELLSSFFSSGHNPVSEIKESKKSIDDYKKMLKSIDLESSDRTTSDNPDDINDFKYGDNKLDGGSLKTAEHGTHVAGIIASVSNINKNNNIKIMAIRVIPTKGGDENDKDVALAIRYAVDNGAKVVNMSFNKIFSINTSWVKDAIKYAQQKDVLLVNASGNDSENADKILFYPNDEYTDSQEYVDNYIIVGSTNYKFNDSIVSNFSNYGKKRVDIFAPGEKIWSTMPGNKYDFDSGTSMAAPLVSGIAAVVRSQYPNLTASQVKTILMDSGLKLKMKVNTPNSFGMFEGGEVSDEIGMEEGMEIGEDFEIGAEEEIEEGTEILEDIDMEEFENIADDSVNLVDFSELCKSGRIVNLYNALIMASRECK